MSLYIHCDYCNAHRPKDEDEDSWQTLEVFRTILPDKTGKMMQSVAAVLHFCPACTYRIEPIGEVIRRGAMDTKRPKGRGSKGDLGPHYNEETHR